MKLIILATLFLAVSVLGAPRRYYHQRRYYKTQRQPLRGYTASAPSTQISYENSVNTQRNSASDLSPKVSFESYGNGGNSYYILRGASKFVKTKEQGIVPLDTKNKLNEEQRNQFLPVMKALYKVMETSTPAPEDVNTLLVLTRDLTKDLPGGGSGLPVIAGFNIDNMGLLPEGDVIVDIEGVPYINTQFGSFPLSDVSLMTDEERARFLPATKTFISVLEKENIDQNEIQTLIDQSEELKELIPENLRGLASGFGSQAAGIASQDDTSNIVEARIPQVTIYSG